MLSGGSFAPNCQGLANLLFRYILCFCVTAPLPYVADCLLVFRVGLLALLLLCGSLGTLYHQPPIVCCLQDSVSVCLGGPVVISVSREEARDLVYDPWIHAFCQLPLFFRISEH